jgi:hypothetical protein
VLGPLRLTRALEPLLDDDARVVMVTSGLGRISSQPARRSAEPRDSGEGVPCPPAAPIHREKKMILARALAGAVALALPFAASASRCDDVLAALGSRLADATCFESTDLTTTNPSTTPLDNTLPGVPVGAWTPRTDRGVIVGAPADNTPITHAVPGIQLNARIADDPTGQARFLLRLPNDWNGRLVVAGASGTRSEFNGDFAWSDYVVQKGYAYASQNKGVLNLRLSTIADPLACRLNPALPVYVHFYDNDDGQPFSRWAQFMISAAQLARDGVKGAYGSPPRYTYAVGTSNGGYQVRRAVELAPKLFDGGVDWEGTFVDPAGPNIPTDLPPAILNYPGAAHHRRWNHGCAAADRSSRAGLCAQRRFGARGKPRQEGAVPLV